MAETVATFNLVTAVMGCLKPVSECIGNWFGRKNTGSDPQGNNHPIVNIYNHLGHPAAPSGPAAPPAPAAPQASGNGSTSSGAPSAEKVYSSRTELIAMGLWGHPDEGNPFDHNGYDGIKTIEIASGDAIDSIKVQYTKRGELVWTSRAGGVGGHSTNKIVLRDGEYINEIRGHCGTYGGTGTINSITFFTNLSSKFGPYGWSDPVKGQLEPSPFFVTGGKIVGIHGTAGKYVHSIGFYVSPN